MNRETDCARPKRHKMALLTFLGLLVPVHFIPPALQALLPQHQLLALPVSVALMVGLMSYFITPLMTRAAAGWLYR
jgi:antibiotic biosynthesis monooxygenase (ABM) superfamily enzyme